MKEKSIYLDEEILGMKQLFKKNMTHALVPQHQHQHQHQAQA